MHRAVKPPKAANHNGIRFAQLSQWRPSKALIARCNSAVGTALPERCRRSSVGSLVPEWRGGFGALFTQEAAYYTEPYGPPWEGRDEIVRQWLDRKDESGQAQFSWHPLAVTSEVAVIQGEVAYPSEGHTYSNLWVIRLDAEVAAPSSPSGGCATLSPPSQLLSPRTSRRPTPQASSARLSAEGGGAACRVDIGGDTASQQEDGPGNQVGSVAMFCTEVHRGEGAPRRASDPGGCGGGRCAG
jgi:hypothetical protein